MQPLPFLSKVQRGSVTIATRQPHSTTRPSPWPLSNQHSLLSLCLVSVTLSYFQDRRRILRCLLVVMNMCFEGPVLFSKIRASKRRECANQFGLVRLAVFDWWYKRRPFLRTLQLFYSAMFRRSLSRSFSDLPTKTLKNAGSSLWLVL